MSTQVFHPPFAEIQLLYEDENLLVLDKPACMHSVSQAESTNTVAQWLSLHFPDQNKVTGGRKGDAGLIQRLDFETSGAILAARNSISWQFLRNTLLEGRLHKTYLSVLEGEAPADRHVRSFIGPRHRGSRKVSCWEQMPKGVRSLEGETEFSNLGKLFGHTVVRATASVARRHQIRAHASWIGHPLLGDALYGSTSALSEVFREQNPPPFFLHSEHLSLTSPNGKRIEVRSPLPPYAQALRELMREADGVER